MRDLPPEPKSSEITPEDAYNSRREFIKNAALYFGTATGIGAGLVYLSSRAKAPASVAATTPSLPISNSQQPAPSSGEAANTQQSQSQPEPPKPKINYDTNEAKNTFEQITTYNNFYEFGTSKSDPAANAFTLKPRPWTIAVEGEVKKPQMIDIETLLKWFPLEERIYRMRCVEAWSMVIPWLGFPLGDLVKRLEPTSKAKYIAFTTLLDPKQMPGQERETLDWPYVEGLRIDEAVHPLTMLAVGLYGKSLLNQNGAPIRLVVPWKYGFKNIKSIVKIRFTEEMPPTSWNKAASNEYGFYANVNPEVDHPRWSQASERRIGDFTRRKTLMFNGYGDHVASLYTGMDLAKWF